MYASDPEGRTPTREERGFTIIELMIVVTVIAILAAIAIPNALAARLRANETSAISSIRTVWTGQIQFQKTARADLDDDGQGEYGFFRELSARYGVRTAGDGTAVGGLLRPAIISAGLGKVNPAGGASRSGYFFQILLPDAAGQEVLERPIGAFSGNVDTDLAEVFFAIVAWPTNYGNTGNRTFFVNQGGDITFADDASYSGANMYVSGAAGMALLFGGDINSMTGVIASGTLGRDGNIWKNVQ